MVARPRQDLERAGVEQPLGTVLADGGYWNRRRSQPCAPTAST
jgi:hypothetical protein